MKIITENATGKVIFAFSADTPVILGQHLIAPSTCFDVSSSTHTLQVVEPNLDYVAGYWKYVGGQWLPVVQEAWDTYKQSVLAVELEKAKLAKLLQINEWRLKANEVSFFFAGKHIAADIVSKFDIVITHGEVMSLGTMPVGWAAVGGWKTLDNSYVPIPDVATWKAFHTALFNQGLTNFGHAQTLKATVTNANTLEQVAAVVW
jgi:hypothetical protein